MTDSPQQPEQTQPLPVISVPQIANQPTWTGSLSSEDPPDKKHRLEQEANNARHKRWRSTALFAVTLIGLSIVFWLCLQILSNPQASADDKKWATALIASIVSGSIGFVTGKAIA